MKSKPAKPAKKRTKSAAAIKSAATAKSAAATAKAAAAAKSATAIAKSTAAATAKPAVAATAKPVPPLLRIVCRALDGKKAGELRVLRVSEQSSITDYLVIATGTSEPHLRALRVELEKAIDATGTRIIGMDTGEPGSGWLVIDAFDVMIHVLTQENRERYSLENLWKDAAELSTDELLGKHPAKPVKKAAGKK
ncbi:MAG: ribosome silencing factor, partial [Opitutaceae bacterium]|nr:ribosome silencing factor [Opitutaceae bacterium]